MRTQPQRGDMTGARSPAGRCQVCTVATSSGGHGGGEKWVPSGEVAGTSLQRERLPRVFPGAEPRGGGSPRPHGDSRARRWPSWAWTASEVPTLPSRAPQAGRPSRPLPRDSPRLPLLSGLLPSAGPLASPARPPSKAPSTVPLFPFPLTANAVPGATVRPWAFDPEGSTLSGPPRLGGRAAASL